MRELAGQDPRYGYHKIRIFLARQGHPMSVDRAYRLWCQAGVQVPRATCGQISELERPDTVSRSV